MVPSELYDHALETGMFEYDNGNMKMFNDIDMNNHRIKNIPPAINPTDLLMKQSLSIPHVFLFGMVRKYHFLPEFFWMTLFTNPYIKSFTLFGRNQHKNMNDQLSISIVGHPSPYNYSFSFPPINASVTIEINKKFSASIEYIKLRSNTEIPFILTYFPLSFNI